MAIDGNDLAAIAAYLKIAEQQHDSIGRSVHAHGSDWLVVHQIGAQAADGSGLAIAIKAGAEAELMPCQTYVIRLPPRLQVDG